MVSRKCSYEGDFYNGNKSVHVTSVHLESIPSPCLAEMLVKRSMFGPRTLPIEPVIMGTSDFGHEICISEV